MFRKKNYWLLTSVFIFNFCLNCSTRTLHNSYFQQAVTYELGAGRFGDNLLSYIHAKWISYKFNIPLLYKPFVYSDQLALHEEEYEYETADLKNFKEIVVLGKANVRKLSNSHFVLYIVPYFPESKYELLNGTSFSGGSWDYFDVDWQDQKFINELRKTILPVNPIESMNLPSDRITVAVHLRKGGKHDDEYTLKAFPLKFLPDDFFINQIKELYFLLKEKPLYVYLFTDDNNPEEIKKKFENELQQYNVEFACRTEGNSETANVVEDFFLMQQFDCLIHSESNFSFIASKIGNYKVSIFPDSFRREDGKIIYDQAHITINKNHEKYPHNFLTKYIFRKIGLLFE